MSHMEPGEIEDEPVATSEQAQDQMQAKARKEENTPSGPTFFAFLSFFIALILLLTFLTNTSLDGLTRLLVLFGLIAFGIIGALLLEKRPLLTTLLGPTLRQQDLVREDKPAAVSIAATQEENETGMLTPFELLVQEALNAIPSEFQEQMDNLAVFVESEPDIETLRRFGAVEGEILLGLYQGTPLTAQGYRHASLPERITLYQRPIEIYCHGDSIRIREQVQQTLLHEIAHHFGMDHEEMPIWIK